MDKRIKRRAAAAIRRMLEAAKELVEIEKQDKRKRARKGADNDVR